MILGRGHAQTDEEIIAEYHGYLRQYHPASSQVIRQRLRDVPEAMKSRIGKRISEWSDAEIIGLYGKRAKSSCTGYTVFLAFLFFRGYRQATVFLLTTLQLQLCRHFRPALIPIRQRLVQAEQDLCYTPSARAPELNLLIYLLAVSGKPLDEISRGDFDAFQDEYQTWYRKTCRRGEGKPNARLFRLERFLIHWGIMPPAKRILRHEEHFARLQHTAIRNAILTYMHWCAAKYKVSTIYSRRAALLNFFLWLQEFCPTATGLDDVTRTIALDYAHRLKGQTDNGSYSLKYACDQQRCLRLFYEFAIEERLPSSPDRNPFSMRDLPQEPDPVPRYLSDQEVRAILTYCANGASLKEKTLVITLLHTGIRAAELAALKTTDVVQIQGTWKLHIREGKGLKDRIIPLTNQCLQALQTWQSQGWENVNANLFTRYGRPWVGGSTVCSVIRNLGLKIGLTGLTPHRFRHTFAVALLNYGMRESALQKLMGHSTLNMTLEYARILDKTVELAFQTAVEKMQSGPISWVPDFLQADEYSVIANGDTLNWIRLPLGYCRRHPKFHCEGDVKCLLCDRFCASADDLPRLFEMHDRYLKLNMHTKAAAIHDQIVSLQSSNHLEVSEKQTPRTQCASCS